VPPKFGSSEKMDQNDGSFVALAFKLHRHQVRPPRPGKCSCMRRAVRSQQFTQLPPVEQARAEARRSNAGPAPRFPGMCITPARPLCGLEADLAPKGRVPRFVGNAMTQLSDRTDQMQPAPVNLRRAVARRSGWTVRLDALRTRQSSLVRIWELLIVASNRLGLWSNHCQSVLGAEEF
jgi:hypothetical protein